MATLCADYLAAAEKGLVLGKRKRHKSESTLATDRGRIERHIKPLLGSMEPPEAAVRLTAYGVAVLTRFAATIEPAFASLLPLRWTEEYAAPASVLVGGTIIVITSTLLTWWNARYVAQRIERLVTRRATPGAAGDEIDEIEHVVDRLSSAMLANDALSPNCCSKGMRS